MFGIFQLGDGLDEIEEDLLCDVLSVVGISQHLGAEVVDSLLGRLKQMEHGLGVRSPPIGLEAVVEIHVQSEEHGSNQNINRNLPFKKRNFIPGSVRTLVRSPVVVPFPHG